MQTATIRWQSGERFAAQLPSGHELLLDSDRQSNTGPGPMELLLAALGACTATDMVIILAKKRQKLEMLEVSVSGERAASPPQVWTTMQVVFRVRGRSESGGPIDEKAVADAYDTITSDRIYKKGRSPKEARAELERCGGAQFDPEMLRIFLELLRRSPQPQLATPTR